MARTDERGRFALDQTPERLAVAGQYGSHDGVVVRDRRGALEGLSFDAVVSPFECRRWSADASVTWKCDRRP